MEKPQAGCKQYCTTLPVISLHSENKCVFLYPVFLEGPEGKSTFCQMWNIFPTKESLPTGVIVVLVSQSAMLALFDTSFLKKIPLVLSLELSKLQKWNGETQSELRATSPVQHSGRVGQFAPTDVVPTPRQLQPLLKPH